MKDNIITRKYFNELAAAWQDGTNEDIQKIYNILSEYNFKSVETILDIGCGTGILFPILNQLTNKQARIYGIDFAGDMLKKAKANNNSLSQVICGDVQYYPFYDNTFHRIIAFHVFPHIINKSLALNECRRILQNNGELIIMHLSSSEEVNSFHSSLNGPVNTHVLPSLDKMKQLLNESKFEVQTSIDRPGLYLVSSCKVE